MKPDIAAVLEQNRGVIRRADYPLLIQRLDRLRTSGELTSPLPGVLWLPSCATDFEASVLAGQLWAGPDAVLVGRAAARLTFWPDAPVEEFSFVSRRRRNLKVGAWTAKYRDLPPELVVRRGQIGFTAAALTVVDLAADPDGGDIIDRALRSGRHTGVTLDRLWEAFDSQPHRRNNPQRRAILVDSRDSPWSEGERGLHRLLRRHGLTGWRTNVHLKIGEADYYPDVLFGSQRLVVEFDGWEFHQSREAFERDRRRRNELELAGYCVLSFTWRQLIEQPEWVISCIKRGLAR